MKNSKVVVVSGFGCPEHRWSNWLKPSFENVSVLGIHRVLSRASRAGIRECAKIVREELSLAKPDVLILHDFGVTFGLLALLGLKKQGGHLPSKLIVFNGAFSGFKVWRSTHPLTMQVLASGKVERRIQLAGGELDSLLRGRWSSVKALYREVIVASLVEGVPGILGKSFPNPFAKMPIETLVLASSNDPFIPLENVRSLANMQPRSRLQISEYGHFPYSIATDDLRRSMEAFVEL